MSNTIADKYFKIKEELFKHVGFTPSWIEYAIDDATKYFWNIKDGVICYSEIIPFNEESNNYYEDKIYPQRFYPKHVYRGVDVTMVFCDPLTDDCKWFRIFDTKKEIK